MINDEVFQNDQFGSICMRSLWQCLQMIIVEVNDQYGSVSKCFKMINLEVFQNDQCGSVSMWSSCKQIKDGHMAVFPRDQFGSVSM